MEEIEFKTTKAIFSIKNNVQVEEINLDESDFILNEINPLG